MTHDDFITIVRRPETVKAEYETDLKELVELYPYFVQARLLQVKALKQSNNIHFASNLRVASVYCSNRRWLYYYLNPEKTASTETYQRNKVGKSSGDYFDMIKMIENEGEDTKQSLKNLADKLKSARAMVIAPMAQQVKKPVTGTGNISEQITEKKIEVKSKFEEQEVTRTADISEDNAKKLISEHKYKEAIEILRALNLNNPKKSVYFADQIRFLEKVIANSKK